MRYLNKSLFRDVFIECILDATHRPSEHIRTIQLSVLTSPSAAAKRENTERLDKLSQWKLSSHKSTYCSCSELSLHSRSS